MASQEHYRKLERMYASAPVNLFFGCTLRVSKGRAEVLIPIRKEYFHAAGSTHGAIYFKALDDAAFFAVSSLVEDYFVFTASFTSYFTRPVSGGAIKAVGSVMHQSRRVFVAEAQLEDSEGRQVALGSGSYMRSVIELSPDIGYV